MTLQRRREATSGVTSAVILTYTVSAFFRFVAALQLL